MQPCPTILTVPLPLLFHLVLILARILLQELCAEVRVTLCLAVRSRSTLRYTGSTQSRPTLSTSTPSGSRRPIDAIGLDKAVPSFPLALLLVELLDSADAKFPSFKFLAFKCNLSFTCAIDGGELDEGTAVVGLELYALETVGLDEWLDAGVRNGVGEVEDGD